MNGSFSPQNGAESTPVLSRYD